MHKLFSFFDKKNLACTLNVLKIDQQFLNKTIYEKTFKKAFIK